VRSAVRAAIVGCALSGGCATTSATRSSDGWITRSVKSGDSSALTVRYRIGIPAPDWELHGDRTADVSYWSRSLGATLFADTTCGDRYDDVPLTVLLNHQLFGFEGARTESESAAEIGGRAALRRRASGKLDGVEVAILLTVVKKGPCIFDFVGIAPPERLPSLEPAYDAFVGGFAVEMTE
jgi:hypothetical protein